VVWLDDVPEPPDMEDEAGIGLTVTVMPPLPLDPPICMLEEPIPLIMDVPVEDDM